MKKRRFVAVVCLGGLLVIAAAICQNLLPGRTAAAQEKQKSGEVDSTSNAADRAAIEKSSRDFATAFAKGDAKAIAAIWTKNGEYHADDGTSLRGRDAIEEAFREYFKENKPGKIDVLIESITFPSDNLAIEEGVLRHNGDGKELPVTTLYSVLHVREGGKWKVAVSREWGAGQDRLEDLHWLLGTWTAKTKDRHVSLSLKRDGKKPFVTGQFTRKSEGKSDSSGTITIALDPETGRLRSWHFDNDGGHGQALWVRDGNSWVLDAAGVLADGAQTGAVNIITRLGPNEITWRSIDRVADDVELPDTIPVKLNRIGKAK